jgi:type II secretory pathway pseudopilin PulG
MPTKPKTSGMAVASFIMAFLPVLNCIGFILGIIALVQISNKSKRLQGSGLAIGGLVISVIIWPVVGILASMLLPTLAKPKARANRMKCASNIKQVGYAFQAFADDNNDRYPWLLYPGDERAQGGGVSGWSQETSTLFAHPTIKSYLGSAKILVSPLDPAYRGVNDGIDLSLVDLANPVPNGGHSYGVVNGAGGAGMAADAARPNTILLVTRNISGPANGEDSLSDQSENSGTASYRATAVWKGADRQPVDARTMAGLNANQGQLGLADGSVSQSNNADLEMKIRAHHNALGGNYKGSPSGFLDTPND